MAKRILVVTGSPRRKGNSELLAEAFATGAESAGHTVARFDTAFDRVDACSACETCWSRGKACSFDDGFDRLAPMLEEADLLVLCGPLYWYTFSAQLKAAIDKMYAFNVPRCPRKLPVTESAPLMTAEESDPAIFNGVAETYKAIAGWMKWRDRGMLLVTGVHARGEIAETDALARAREMGHAL